MRLKGRVAIVTGGGVGIGRAYCFGLAKEGAKVVVADINFEAAQKVAQEIIKQKGEALAVNVDVSDEKSTREMAKKAMEKFGGIDILVNNAAIFTALMPPKPWDQVPLDEWDRVMAVNLRGILLCCRAVVPQMKTQGKGKIVNIASSTAWHGITGAIHYVTSKGGVIAFTRALSRELTGANINVNGLAPGLTLSEKVLAKGGFADSDEAEMVRKMRVSQKHLYPEDLVGTMIFLASDDSDSLFGQTILVDGGSVFH